MRTSTLVTAALVAALCLMSACGNGGEQRPYVVSTWPANGEVVQGALPYIRVTYNEPVSFLNPSDLRVHINDALSAVSVARFPEEPNSVYLLPRGRSAFAPDSVISVLVIQGFVINRERHHADDLFFVAFRSEGEPSLPVGESGQVSLVDCLTGVTLESVPTPGGRDPVGVLSTLVAGTRRIWVQLASGAGVAESLAWFEPGDAAMTTLSLSSAGTDLTATTSAMALGPFGGELYVAYRDETSERVRVLLIDTAAASELAAVELASVAANALTTPTGMAITEGTGASRFHVSAADGATGTLAAIDRATFAEVDFEDGALGVQGIALLGGGGPTAVASSTTVVASPASTDADVVPAGGPTVAAVGALSGTTTVIARAPDGALTLQGLAGYAGMEALQQRTRTGSFDDPTAVEVSDLLGLTSQAATAVLGVSFFTSGDRFVVILDTPTGALLTEWTYANGGTLEQVDLDDATAGIQALPLTVTPLVVGTNRGAFP